MDPCSLGLWSWLCPSLAALSWTNPSISLNFDFLPWKLEAVKDKLLSFSSCLGSTKSSKCLAFPFWLIFQFPRTMKLKCLRTESNTQDIFYIAIQLTKAVLILPMHSASCILYLSSFLSFQKLMVALLCNFFYIDGCILLQRDSMRKFGGDGIVTVMWLHRTMYVFTCIELCTKGKSILLHVHLKSKVLKQENN